MTGKLTPKEIKRITKMVDKVRIALWDVEDEFNRLDHHGANNVSDAIEALCDLYDASGNVNPVKSSWSMERAP